MMIRTSRTAAIALACTVAGMGLVGGAGSMANASSSGSATDTGATQQASFTGTKKITVNGKSVNVSCSGSRVDGRPVVVLLHGGGDSLKRLAGIQKALSAQDRVCSYDRLGAGASDKPQRKQTFKSTGRILTGVIDRVAGDAPVVLAGHSLGGLIAARYAPDHKDTVKGLVLLDATSPTQIADLKREIPKSAKGPAAQLRAQTLAIFRGKSPEKLVVTDGKVRSAGDIPVKVVRHGKRYLEAIPKYGPGLERAWTKGQHKWLKLSDRSHVRKAKKSGHYIYEDQPGVATQVIRRVATQVAG